jgi:excisionase family DNA binding protein
MNELLSIKDVMANLHISRATLYKHIKRGDLVAYRVGRLVRITPGDLGEFVRRGRCARPRRSR